MTAPRCESCGYVESHDPNCPRPQDEETPAPQKYPAMPVTPSGPAGAGPMLRVDAEIMRTARIGAGSGMEQAWQDMCHFARELAHEMENPAQQENKANPPREGGVISTGTRDCRGLPNEPAGAGPTSVAQFIESLPLNWDHFPADAAEGWEMLCRAKAKYQKLERELAAEKERGFALAANQCIVDGGLVGDEGGSPICTVKADLAAVTAERDALREDKERLDFAESNPEKVMRAITYWWVTCGTGFGFRGRIDAARKK